MKIKLILSTAAAVWFGSSAMVIAGGAPPPVSNPPSAPGIYNNGPASPNVNQTDMRVAERNAFALGEALMQSVESYIYVNGCDTSVNLPVEVYSHPASNDHYLADTSFFGIELLAAPGLDIAGFGQKINVIQPVPGYINGKVVQNVRGTYTYNDKNNMMVNEQTFIQVASQLRGIDTYYSTVIKDFFTGDTYDSSGNPVVLYDYGLQSLSKFGYPVNKWWQRSVAVRDNGQQACTVFVKDRLVGNTSCRITLATAGVSQLDLYEQSGSLIVEAVSPSAPSDALEACSVNPIFVNGIG